MKISVSEAISHIHPNSEFVIYNNDLDRLTFIKPDNLTVTQEQVDQAIIELGQIRQAEAEAKATQKAALLERLGISQDEARLLLA
jgi:hypothetical protein